MSKKKPKKLDVDNNRFHLTQKVKEFKDFFDQSKIEMKKVTYPSQKQTMTTCASVLGLLVIVSGFLGIVDVALAKILEVILS
jgi:preprotein translocase subunit SecE